MIVTYIPDIAIMQVPHQTTSKIKAKKKGGKIWEKKVSNVLSSPA